MLRHYVGIIKPGMGKKIGLATLTFGPEVHFESPKVNVITGENVDTVMIFFTSV